ncbi:hypothetical protein [uncultured Mediterranea sp.]|mgnify:CR=1 FL=1|uniref:hypothetical protein n=1 Tax=uncultured Mediterranea sp. TaxID=1926662 RepID=UPI0027D99C9C|nr:hypothetical protein [uncultured Mediterranea sp.]
MEFINRIKSRIKNKITKKSNKTIAIYNINYDASKKQKKIAFIYRETLFSNPIKLENIRHVNVLHQFQMIKVLIEHNYCIDIYSCSSYTPNLIKSDYYDTILGFGANYIELCKHNKQAIKILFITENAPWIVKNKFEERLKYYRARHHKNPYSISRTQFYNKEMFDISDIGIVMNGSHNLKEISKSFNKSYQINVNALFNPNIQSVPFKDYKKIRKNFVWFGSNGLIHKGLDILIDAFSLLPDYTLNVYGAPEKELREFKIPSNVIIHSSVNVYSKEFINDVVCQNTFTLSLSCSEGMMSGIATCMAHGLIPITTVETGFDDFKDNIIFKSHKLEDVIDTIKGTTKLDEQQLQQLSSRTFEYSQKAYSINNFTNKFNDIISEIEKQPIL